MKKEHEYVSDYVFFGKMTAEYEKSHQFLSEIVKDLPEDYDPYGKQQRDEPCADDPDYYQHYSDCSCGCKWYIKLSEPFSCDWGVCSNPISHRCGLLTFEHQGCTHFEQEEEECENN